ncbi:MAG: UDP-N-acetylmuramoyl-L-alanyl-D-glutamate--2,6-diaminopimelate ligase [Phycisphaeraceae bacterium]|nr:UDP-N-acetylmuramoyl-L-alanyl-D-glutamate--2,6-diaminopimelate ligase [Phycisphaeraceae bacterium]
MDLARLIEGTGIRASGACAGVVIRGVTEDSRRAGPGDLFIARPGTVADGRAFIDDAVARGAAAVLTDRSVETIGAPGGAVLLVADDVPTAAARLAERFHGDPSTRLTLIGITGTNGKTTTAHLVQQLLIGAGVPCGLIGTVFTDDGSGPRESSLTTPAAVEISATLARMVANGCRAAVMEVSSHALDQRRAAGLRFAAAVFTNLTGDHQDYHGSMDNYAAAKARLFDALPPNAAAIVNADDPWHERMIRSCAAGVVRCREWKMAEEAEGRRVKEERGAAAEVMVLAASPTGMRLRISGAWGGIESLVPLVGRHNAMNVLQAVAAAHAACAISAESIARSLSTLRPPPGRLEPAHRHDDGVRVFVDYAHTDDALRNTLRAVRPLVDAERGERLWVVFGCGGDRDRTKRPRMGAAAAELADAIVVTSDNPRRERPEAIIAEIMAGIEGGASDRVLVEPDRSRAIALAVDRAATGDWIVIAGKGHETYQLLPDGTGGVRRIDFDDLRVAREALERRKAGGERAA